MTKAKTVRPNVPLRMMVLLPQNIDSLHLQAFTPAEREIGKATDPTRLDGHHRRSSYGRKRCPLACEPFARQTEGIPDRRAKQASTQACGDWCCSHGRGVHRHILNS
jgi:hypothetical protein